MHIHGLIAAGALMTLALATAGPAGATTIDFEAGALADGTAVSTQFATQGVRFTAGPPLGGLALPKIVLGSARSPARGLDISTNADEFPTPSLAGQFTSTHSQLSVWVRNVTSDARTFTSHLKLEGLDAGGSVVATSPVTAVDSHGPYVQLSASAAGPVIAALRVTAASTDPPGQNIEADDLSFDDPVVSTPDFALSTDLRGQLVLPLGVARATALHVDRINGFSGSLTFGAAAPPGISATFAPGPGGDETVRLTAAPGVALGGPLSVAITVSSGALSHSIALPVIPRAAFSISGANRVELAPCGRVEVPLDVSRQDGVDPVALSLAGPLPADLHADVVAGTGDHATLVLTRGDSTDTADVPVSIRGTAGTAVGDFATTTVARVAGRISAVPSGGLAAPALLRAGDRVTVSGTGICAGSTLEFGNANARAPITGATALVPRLATDGPLTVVTPAGARSNPTAPVAIQTYRDSNGFSFPNEAWQGGDFADWQELYGYDQTHIGIDLCFPFGCNVTSPIPRPDLALFIPFADLALRGGGGSCVGFSFASRRLASGQVPFSRFDPRAHSVWQLPKTPSLMHYIWVQHQNQLSGEFLHSYLSQRAGGATALINASDVRERVERILRAGHAPVLVMANGGGGHAIVVYDTENAPDGGFYLRTYDNNVPFALAENSDPAAHLAAEQNSRVHIAADGHWDFPNLSGYSGGLGDLAVIDVDRDIPLQPSLPMTLEGITTLIFGAGTPGNAPAATRIPMLDNPNPSPVFAAPSDRVVDYAVKPDAHGKMQLAFAGSGAAASVQATGAGSTLSVLKHGDGLSFAGNVRGVVATVARAGRRATVRSDGAVTLTQTSDGTITAAGAGALRITLDSGTAQFQSPPLRLAAGETVRLRPDWRTLTTVDAHVSSGAHMRLRNTLAQRTRITTMRLRVTRQGKTAVVKVSAKVVGRTSAVVAAAAVRAGARTLGKASVTLDKNARTATLRIPLSGRIPAKGVRVHVGFMAVGATTASRTMARSL